MPTQYNPTPTDFMDWLVDLAKRNNKEFQEYKRKTLKGPWIKPELTGDYTFPTDPDKEPLQYRFNQWESLDWKGYLSPGTTNTVAFTVIEPFRFTTIKSWLMDLDADAGFSVARMILAVNGEATIQYPAVT